MTQPESLKSFTDRVFMEGYLIFLLNNSVKKYTAKSVKMQFQLEAKYSPRRDQLKP
jgi:hypothetical protein